MRAGVSERPAGQAAMWLVCLALAGYAWLAFGSGMDRLAAGQPEQAELVPAVLRADAARVEAAAAIEIGSLYSAEMLAIEALDADPRDFRSTSLLGAIRLLRGDPWAAQHAFVAARMLGVRDPVTQSYWTNDLIERGRAAQAVPYFEALMRGWPGYPTIEELLIDLTRDADGRAALAARIAEHEPFALAIFAVDHQDMSASVALRGELLLDPALEEQPHGCAIAREVIEGLAERQMSAQAEAVAQQHCSI